MTTQSCLWRPSEPCISCVSSLFLSLTPPALLSSAYATSQHCFDRSRSCGTFYTARWNCHRHCHMHCLSCGQRNVLHEFMFLLSHRYDLTGFLIINSNLFVTSGAARVITAARKNKTDTTEWAHQNGLDSKWQHKYYSSVHLKSWMLQKRRGYLYFRYCDLMCIQVKWFVEMKKSVGQRLGSIHQVSIQWRPIWIRICSLL